VVEYVGYVEPEEAGQDLSPSGPGQPDG
jgi:hypothetical protein